MPNRTRSAETESLQHPPTEHPRNYAQVAYEFALEASKDRYGKKHCKWVRLAAKRHLADLKKVRRKAYPYEFSEWWANDVCDFAEKFPHIEGEWESPLIQLEPAQIFILCSVFGWRRKDTGKRRFTMVYIEMARKGAKSTLTAVVSHYCLSCEGELGAQIIIGATTGDQANKVFHPARRMAQLTPEYRDAFGVEVYAKSITCANTGGYIQAINAKSSTQDGHNPHVGILDELHAHKDRGLYDVIRSAFGARKNPLMWVITTAGYNVMGVCYEQRTLVTKILEGTLPADHYFGIIFTLDEKDNELDESKWIKANPLLGVTPTVEEMREVAIEAKAAPGTMGEFKTKRLNIWTSARDAWINMQTWNRNPSGPLDLEWLKQFPCYGGLDLASTEDITAFVLAWLIEEQLYVRGRYYLPEAVVEPRTQRGNVPYQTWAADGGPLIVTPGEVTDYDYLERDILEACEQFDVQYIGYDRHNSSQLVNNLQNEFGDDKMVQIAQTPLSFNPAMMEVERLYKKRSVHHGGCPALAWMISNIVVRTDVNGNRAPDRKNSMEKIDGGVAMLNALVLAIMNQGSGPSFWESDAAA